jgi:hypothetical protein
MVAVILGGSFKSLTSPNLPMNSDSRNHLKPQTKSVQERKNKSITQNIEEPSWLGPCFLNPKIQMRIVLSNIWGSP